VIARVALRHVATRQGGCLRTKRKHGPVRRGRPSGRGPLNRTIHASHRAGRGRGPSRPWGWRSGRRAPRPRGQRSPRGPDRTPATAAGSPGGDRARRSAPAGAQAGRGRCGVGRPGPSRRPASPGAIRPVAAGRGPWRPADGTSFQEESYELSEGRGAVGGVPPRSPVATERPRGRARCPSPRRTCVSFRAHPAMPLIGTPQPARPTESPLEVPHTGSEKHRPPRRPVRQL